MKKGMEEISGYQQIGDYLQEVEGGRHIILRGKFKGGYLDTIPRGYIRKFILKKWIDGMTEEELELFEKYGKKDEEKEMPEKDTVTEAFEKVAKEGGSVEIPLTKAPTEGTLDEEETTKPEVKPTRTKATDEEMKESEEALARVEESEAEEAKKED